MQFHIPNSHPIKLIGSNSSVYISVSFNSFVANASRLYFKGDRNSNHPIHFGRSFLFFQNPENNINGKIKAGAIAVATFTSPNRLPICNPNAFPLKLHKIFINTIEKQNQKQNKIIVTENKKLLRPII